MRLYRVTFHLDLELQHTLDVDSSGDHRVQVWWQYPPICLVEEAICAKSLQTEEQTDDGRRAIALAHKYLHLSILDVAYLAIFRT